MKTYKIQFFELHPEEEHFLFINFADTNRDNLGEMKPDLA